MAVARVFGRVDGVDVVMEQTQGDMVSTGPLDQDGEYVVEIIAVDEAGNQSYMAKMLFCVDSSRLCVRVLPGAVLRGTVRWRILRRCAPGSLSCGTAGIMLSVWERRMRVQKIIFDTGEQRHVRLMIHAADNARSD